jgi:hypothetical protein
MTEPTTTPTVNDGVIDLNASRAARREGKARELRITLGDAHITLPPEFPLDALSPLTDVDLDLGMVVAARDPEQMLRDLATARPAIVVEAVKAGKAVLEGLFCSCGAYVANLSLLPGEDREAHEECQWSAFIAERPSGQDLAALGKGLLAAYGVSLGEALASSGSAGSGGTTSRQTSSGTTTSTRAKRGKRTVQAVPASVSVG